MWAANSREEAIDDNPLRSSQTHTSQATEPSYQLLLHNLTHDSKTKTTAAAERLHQGQRPVRLCGEAKPVTTARSNKTEGRAGSKKLKPGPSPNSHGRVRELWRSKSKTEMREKGSLRRRRKRSRAGPATASGGASERVPAPLAPFLVIPFKPSCGCSNLSGISDMRADLGRSGRSSFQRRFWSRDVEAPIALQSPLKFPGCGGFVSSAAPAKLLERGGSDSSIVAGF
ncbi:hypothetical protein HID58_061956 [Brassica napus]|uniref:Uncharacterized protein n=1 Tax=Brassica napus TaxID=3708 RepID=A0ABQ8A022_BRANA|nr:hypothetical protein HID58_061956 [Brassica napus]